MAAKKSGTCIYCGKTGKITKDHVPPRAVFLGSVRGDLISVDACRRCNNSAAKDDEHFRNVVLNIDDVLDHSDARCLFESKIERSIRNDAQRRYWRGFRDNIKEYEVRTEAGLFVGKVTATQYSAHDIDRVEAVIDRIVRGLYWHETGEILSSAASTRTTWPDDFASLAPELVQFLLTLEVREIAKGAFSYRMHRFDYDSSCAVWLLVFYDRVKFVVTSNWEALEEDHHRRHGS